MNKQRKFYVDIGSKWVELSPSGLDLVLAEQRFKVATKRRGCTVQITIDKTV